MRRATLALAYMSTLALSSTAVAEESGWRLRLSGYFMGTGDQPVVVDAAGTVLSTDNSAGAGAGLDLAYRFASGLGLDVALLVADHGDFRARPVVRGVDLEATDTMTVKMLTAGLDYDLTRASPTDLYVGVFLALVDYDSFSIAYGGVPPTARVDVDSDLGLGLVLGLDLPLDERHWLLHAHLRYLSTTIDGSGNATLASVDYDPYLIGVGIGYRF